MSEKILICGHTGLIGSNLERKLLQQGHEVYGISKTKGFDLVEAEHISTEMQTIKPRTVYMLAANAAEARGQISPIEMTRNNMGIFVNVLRAAINSGVEKIVYTSSAAVYGVNDKPSKETDATKPHDVYGANKLACEHILKIMADTYKFNYTIFRPHNVYGPGQDLDDPTRNVMALFMRKLLEKQPYNMYGEGKMVRAFSYVDDVVDVLAQAKNRFNDMTINVGSDEVTSIKQLSDKLRVLTKVEVPINQLPANSATIFTFLCEHSLQTGLVTYQNTPLDVGLPITWEWAKQQVLHPLQKQDNEIFIKKI